ncbi:hypothetical protein ABW19_dt0210529 [Dactylella cylindrospora]|nr:hypothetical protein ABW19_dt0210529 [Dactylella cylindrospora]
MYSKRILEAAVIAALAGSALANPIPQVQNSNDTFTNPLRGPPLVTDDILLFDAPAFTVEDGSMQGSFRAFAHVRQINTGLISGALTTAIEALGIEIGAGAHNLFERTKLFLAITRVGVTLDIAVDECNTVKVGGTSKGGLLEQRAPLGACDGKFTPKDISASAPGFFVTRPFSAVLFPSPPTGFGVISDVDDTIKVSNVLDPVKAVKSLLLEDHTAVTGMPELYAKLNSELTTPAWFYLTGSPYQLYPSLREFIFREFPQGPMIVQNLTISDIQSVLKLITDHDNVRNYKIEQMEKIYSYYPNKKFITIGDSTQADPEAYAEIARRHPEFIQCIWVRQVQDADNSPERFATAFADVPPTKWKVFADPAELMNLDPSTGKCN